MAVQVGQRRPVLGQGQRLGLKPPHLGRRGSISANSSTTYDLAHDRIARQSFGIVDVLVSGQPPEHRLPKEAVETVDGVLAGAVIA